MEQKENLITRASGEKCFGVVLCLQFFSDINLIKITISTKAIKIIKTKT